VCSSIYYARKLSEEQIELEEAEHNIRKRGKGGQKEDGIQAYVGGVASLYVCERDKVEKGGVCVRR
jgi:hypothetical protein